MRPPKNIFFCTCMCTGGSRIGITIVLDKIGDRKTKYLYIYICPSHLPATRLTSAFIVDLKELVKSQELGPPLF